MAYVNDPFELTLPPSLEASDIDLEEPEDPKGKFWEEAVQRGRSLPYQHDYSVQFCRFDSAGEHVVMAKNCPHFSTDDEQGRIVTKGWTVQQNAS